MMVMLGFGIVGFIMNKVGLSPAAAILGIVLGPLAETNLRSALVLSQGDISIFFRLIPSIFWILTIVMVGLPPLRRYLKKRKAAKTAATG